MKSLPQVVCGWVASATLLFTASGCLQSIPGTLPSAQPVTPPHSTWKTEAPARLPMPVIQPDGLLNIVVVDLMINGKPERFLVDTASQISMFQRDLCARLEHRQLGAKALVEGIDGTVEVEIICITSIDLGFATLLNVNAEIVPTGFLDSCNKLLRRQGARELSGVLGNDLLMHLGATLHFEEQSIEFHKR